MVRHQTECVWPVCGSEGNDIPFRLAGNECEIISSKGGVVLDDSGRDRSAHANIFTYTNGNVLICFRKAPSGTTDLIVNAGPSPISPILLPTRP